MFKKSSFFIVGLLIITLVFTTIIIIKPFEPVSAIRLRTLSFSVGERRQAWLTLYRHYLDKNDFIQAKSIESHLDPTDSSVLKAQYYPELLAASLNQLLYKDNKTTEDWVAIAKYQIKLGLYSKAKESLYSATLLDPLRDDLVQLYLQLK